MYTYIESIYIYILVLLNHLKKLFFNKNSTALKMICVLLYF